MCGGEWAHSQYMCVFPYNAFFFKGGRGALLSCNTWLTCGCCLAQKGEAEAKAPEPQVEVEEEEEEEIVESDIGKRTPRVSRLSLFGETLWAEHSDDHPLTTLVNHSLLIMNHLPPWW